MKESNLTFQQRLQHAFLIAEKSTAHLQVQEFLRACSLMNSQSLDRAFEEQRRAMEGLPNEKRYS
jgi:hypothetical protein